MRIALLAPLPPVQSGIADYAKIFIQHLQQQQADISTPLAGIDHAVLEQHMTGIDWNRFDLVHAELGGGLTLEFAALQWLMRHAPHVKLTATVHDPERLVWRTHRLPLPDNWQHRLPGAINKGLTLLLDPLTLQAERRLAGHLQRLFVLTRTGANVLQQRMRLPAARIQVIPHATAVLQPQPLPPALPIKLLYFGFIYRGKGIEDLLHALALVFQRNPASKQRLHLTLAGGTRPNMAFTTQGSYCDELKVLAKSLGLTDSLQWLPDLDPQQIAPTLADHHVLILPYRESRRLALLGSMRGTSGVLAWANACGRGVIASDARAFPEELSHGNGALYPQGNTAALADRISALSDNPQTVQQWSQAAQALGQQRAWPDTARRFLHAFEELRNA